MITRITLGLLLALLMVNPAQAWFDFHRDPSVTEFNSAFVKSNTQAGAFTGENSQFTGVSIEKAGADDVDSWGMNKLETGAALTEADSTIVANTNVGCNYCLPRHMSRYQETNMAMVETTTMAQSETGFNTQFAGVTVEKGHVDDIDSCGSNWLETGRATATANSMTLVNVEWNHSGMWD